MDPTYEFISKAFSQHSTIMNGNYEILNLRVDFEKPIVYNFRLMGQHSLAHNYCVIQVEAIPANKDVTNYNVTINYEDRPSDTYKSVSLDTVMHYYRIGTFL